MAKDKKRKIPKEIAGIKIPKKLRKKGEKLISAAQSPLGRDMLMSGIAAMTAAAVSRGMASRATARQEHQPPGEQEHGEPIGPKAYHPNFSNTDPADAGAEAARQFVTGLGAAANDALRRMMTERSKG
ncbi:MAG: hypothetical protein WC803_12625 [Sphingomonas sp.]|jgi:hypothetical protein